MVDLNTVIGVLGVGVAVTAIIGIIIKMRAFEQQIEVVISGSMDAIQWVGRQMEALAETVISALGTIATKMQLMIGSVLKRIMSLFG
jgi:hypothetical protein